VIKRHGEIVEVIFKTVLVQFFQLPVLVDRLVVESNVQSRFNPHVRVKMPLLHPFIDFIEALAS
jgi:hypothetical protein